MDDSLNVPRHMRSPGDDGYRTPTIEDAERTLSDFGIEDSPGGQVLEVHSTALQEVLQRATSRVAEKSKKEGNKEATACFDHNGLGIAVRRKPPSRLGWKKRIRHVTWAYFTLTMATGGLANVFYQVPFQFKGLYTIGVVVFLINIALYLLIWGLLLLRFYCFPYTFRASMMHPTESLFIPAAIVSFGTILINVSQYGPEHAGPWLMRAVCVLFWIDAALAVMFSAGVYLLLWSTQTFTIAQMTPIWIFPAYPMLIIGPHAGVLSSKLDPSAALRVIVGGTTIQGVGFLVSLMVYSAFIYRLMTQKLPKENLRPGMFVSVGPSGFTVAGIVNMAAAAKRAFPSDFMGNGALAADVLKVVVNFSSLWLWGYVLFDGLSLTVLIGSI
ncbi:hypothetical protein PENARI_c026G04881 [Penicillium arizonense]|uniref:C4-dicarboxylate transporter/malic acid transport protein n=1 Tax=Penicillium arizonense TaxID=1835702 RepID=A0A1F5L6W8_PENAI|nr:hypothetical protein PENARI_c026G04881 [Penicillium arizonense]OGE48796.1 hypothetical protein PENARI_c026G04881 [Penicillium arizonense]